MSASQKSWAGGTPLDYVRCLIVDASTALKELPKWEKPFHILWLLGPFFLLIERSPADAWLSILALSFAVRSLCQRDGAWFVHGWVRAAFIFWFVCLLSASLSPAPTYALGEAGSWFRFPLFAMATVFWLGRDERLIYAMILSTFLGMMLMTGILVAEVLIDGFKDGRLTWPYGDAVPGNYLAKAAMPAFLVCVALAARCNKNFIVLMSVGMISATLAVSMLAGERMNLILRIFSGGLAFLLNISRMFNLFVMMLVLCFSAILVISVSPDVYRLAVQFLQRIPLTTDSDYFNLYHGAWLIFTDNVFLGIGTANYRELCSQLTTELSNFRCDNHPHNYYIQLLTETGVIGFVSGIFMIASIVITLVRASCTNNQNIVAATAYIVPLGLFFPLQSTADFFGQWNNIFLWSAVALSMAAVNLRAEPGASQK